MDEIEMLCLANSRKPGGRCVAGLSSDGAWIRPVSTPKSGALSHGQIMLGHEGRQVEPLDVVAVPVERPVPLPYQPENWLIADRPWRHLRTVGIGDSQDLLEQAEYNESTLFGTPHDALNSEGVPSDGISDSLALVRVERPILFRKSRWGRSPQIRARFEFSHNRYDLAVTFEHELDEDEAGRQSASNWWFTVSLGEEFEVGLDVLHYKLVAGALRIPADSP